MGQGRGGSTGYDNAVALPARSDSDELAKENNKSVAALKGQAVFSVAKVRCGRPTAHNAELNARAMLALQTSSYVNARLGSSGSDSTVIQCISPFVNDRLQQLSHRVDCVWYLLCAYSMG